MVNRREILLFYSSQILPWEFIQKIPSYLQILQRRHGNSQNQTFKSLNIAATILTFLRMFSPKSKGLNSKIMTWLFQNVLSITCIEYIYIFLSM